MSDMLAGVRIVDLSRLLPGPYATLRLAEMGAEVIQVEDKGGDAARYVGPRDPSGTGLVFSALHRGKSSLTVDFRSPAGRTQILQLIQQADVVLESFRPGRMKTFGLDYEQLKKVKPDIILCSISGYGQEGQMVSKAGHDLNFMAEGGVLALLAGKSGQPHPLPIQLVDLVAGLAASEAIAAALFKRERTGRGQHVDISMLDALTGLLPIHAGVLSTHQGDMGVPELTGSVLCYNVYPTADDKYVALAALEPKFWRAFCDGVDREQWLSAQFSPADSGNPIFSELTSLFSARTQAEWEQFGLQVDCCLSPVWSLEESLAKAATLRATCLVPLDASGTFSLRTHAGGHFRSD